MNASPPSRLIEAALEIQGFCEHRRWPFCFIGGIAVLHWGEARLTRDAVLTIFTGIGLELDQLLQLKEDSESLPRLEALLTTHSRG